MSQLFYHLLKLPNLGILFVNQNLLHIFILPQSDIFMFKVSQPLGKCRYFLLAILMNNLQLLKPLLLNIILLILGTKLDPLLPKVTFITAQFLNLLLILKNLLIAPAVFLLDVCNFCLGLPEQSAKFAVADHVLLNCILKCVLFLVFLLQSPSAAAVALPNFRPVVGRLVSHRAGLGQSDEAGAGFGGHADWVQGPLAAGLQRDLAAGLAALGLGAPAAFGVLGFGQPGGVTGFWGDEATVF